MVCSCCTRPCGRGDVLGSIYHSNGHYYQYFLSDANAPIVVFRGLARRRQWMEVSMVWCRCGNGSGRLSAHTPPSARCAVRPACCIVHPTYHRAVINWGSLLHSFHQQILEIFELIRKVISTLSFYHESKTRSIDYSDQLLITACSKVWMVLSTFLPVHRVLVQEEKGLLYCRHVRARPYSWTNALFVLGQNQNHDMISYNAYNWLGFGSLKMLKLHFKSSYFI